MAYNHGREERKWRLWKEAEEKILREYGVSERIIEEIHIYDRAEFNSNRRFYRYMNDVAEYLEEMADVVREIFDLALAGNGISKIRKHLNAQHILRPAAYAVERGETGYERYFEDNEDNRYLWSENSVRQILRSPIYVLLKTYPREIAEVTALIDGLKADIATAKENLPADPEHFLMTIGGMVYTGRKEAGTAIIAACAGLKAVNTGGVIGEYAGFTLKAQFDSFSQQYKLSIKGKTTHTIEVGPDLAGNITRINNVVTGLGKNLEKAEQQMQSLHEKVESAKAEIMRPFPQEEELAAKLARLREVNAMLDMDDKGTDRLSAPERATAAADRANTTPIVRVAIPAATQNAYADQPKRASDLDRLKANQAAIATQTKHALIPSHKKDQTL